MHNENEWRQIHEFPRYSVSDTGLIRNDNTERIMKPMVNGRGIPVIGLRKDGIQYKRSITVLVAEAFLYNSRAQPSFNAPINLDGNRFNNQVSNLVLRPRWFATKYFQQFRGHDIAFPSPIEEVDTGQVFRSSWDAATKCGLLDSEILTAMLYNIYVWPTFQRFRRAA